jgi:hypothetical protein
MFLRVYVDLIYVLFRFVANSCYWEAAAPDSVAYSDQVMDRYHTAKSDPDVAALGIEEVIHEYVAAVEAVRKTMEEVSAWTLHIDYNAKRQELLKRIKEFDEKHNIAAEFDQCLKEVITLEKKEKNNKPIDTIAMKSQKSRRLWRILVYPLVLPSPSPSWNTTAARARRPRSQL